MLSKTYPSSTDSQLLQIYLYEETLWGYSSVGRASALQAECQEFDSPYLHVALKYFLSAHYARVTQSGKSAFLIRRKPLVQIQP